MSHQSIPRCIRGNYAELRIYEDVRVCGVGVPTWSQSKVEKAEFEKCVLKLTQLLLKKMLQALVIEVTAEVSIP